MQRKRGESISAGLVLHLLNNGKNHIKGRSFTGILVHTDSNQTRHMIGYTRWAGQTKAFVCNLQAANITNIVVLETWLNSYNETKMADSKPQIDVFGRIHEKRTKGCIVWPKLSSAMKLKLRPSLWCFVFQSLAFPHSEAVANCSSV